MRQVDGATVDRLRAAGVRNDAVVDSAFEWPGGDPGFCGLGAVGDAQLVPDGEDHGSPALVRRRPAQDCDGLSETLTVTLTGSLAR